MLPVLRNGRDGPIAIGEVIERIADELSLSEEARTRLKPSGRISIFADRVHWAKTYLKKAGLVRYPSRGRFEATEAGLAVLRANPTSLRNEDLRRYDSFVAFVSPGRAPASGARSRFETVGQDRDEPEETPDEALSSFVTEIEDALARELLDRITAASPAFFEKLVVNLLLAMGYGGTVQSVDAALVGGAGDGGVDGVIDQDPLGLDRVYVQAKRYREDETVGPGAIRDFFGALDRYKAAKGLFVTTSSFTRDAKETAAMLSKRIVLVDGARLARLMIRHEVGCRPERTIVVKRLDEDFFEG
jgi:restriction system protein